MAVLNMAVQGNLFTPPLAGLVVPVHLLLMAGIFSSRYWVAKALKTVELQRPVTFTDCLGEFFLLWFSSIGIRVLQPRINRLFAT